MPLVVRRALLAAALLVHLLVLYAPAVPSGGAAGVPGADKVAHAGVFAVVVLAALWARLPARVVVPVALAHAVVSEVVQHLLLAGRSGDVWDVVADVVGVGLGWGLAVLVRRRRDDVAPPPSGPDG